MSVAHLRSFDIVTIVIRYIETTSDTIPVFRIRTPGVWLSATSSRTRGDPYAKFADDDDAGHGRRAADPRKRPRAGPRMGPAGRHQADRPSAARSQRPRTRGCPGPRRLRAGRGLRPAHPSGRRD